MWLYLTCMVFTTGEKLSQFAMVAAAQVLTKKKSIFHRSHRQKLICLRMPSAPVLGLTKRGGKPVSACFTFGLDPDYILLWDISAWSASHVGTAKLNCDQYFTKIIGEKCSEVRAALCGHKHMKVIFFPSTFLGVILQDRSVQRCLLTIVFLEWFRSPC